MNTLMEVNRKELISVLKENKQCVTVKKKSAVRYRGGIKSPVLEYVQKGTD